MLRKVVSLLWSVRWNYWEYRVKYDDGTLSAFFPTMINVFMPSKYQEHAKKEVEWKIMGAIENVPDGVPQPSVLIEEHTPDGKERLVAYFVQRLESVLLKLKHEATGLNSEGKTSLLKAAFSIYVDLVSLGVKEKADQLFKAYGVDHTKRSSIPLDELN